MFDPDVFLFLQCRKSKEDKARVLRISDNCILNVLEGFDLQEGDTVQITDPDFGWSGTLALVDAPPRATRANWANITLRVPA